VDGEARTWSILMVPTPLQIVHVATSASWQRALDGPAP
jgi:hypothetical protein